MPQELRPAFRALWDIDLAFADIVATSSDARLGAIRMAWWRERLEELDAGLRPPSEPRLQAAASELLPRGVTGAQLARLEDAWLPLFEPFPWGDEQAEGLRLRGQILFGCGAVLLGEGPREAEAAGSLWAIVDGAAHCSDVPSREFLLREARRLRAQVKIPRMLRPMTSLAALARSDAQTGGTLSRLLAAIRHRMTGRI